MGEILPPGCGGARYRAEFAGSRHLRQAGRVLAGSCSLCQLDQHRSQKGLASSQIQIRASSALVGEPQTQALTNTPPLLRSNHTSRHKLRHRPDKGHAVAGPRSGQYSSAPRIFPSQPPQPAPSLLDLALAECTVFCRQGQTTDALMTLMHSLPTCRCSTVPYSILYFGARPRPLLTVPH